MLDLRSCQDLASTYLERLKSYEILSQLSRDVSNNPRLAIYGAFAFIIAIIFCRRAFGYSLGRASSSRPSTPDLEKPASRSGTSFKAPVRPPGGIVFTHIHRSRQSTNADQYGYQWILSGQLHSQQKIGMSTPQSQTHTALLDGGHIILPWAFVT